MSSMKPTTTTPKGRDGDTDMDVNSGLASEVTDKVDVEGQSSSASTSEGVSYSNPVISKRSSWKKVDGNWIVTETEIKNLNHGSCALTSEGTEVEGQACSSTSKVTEVAGQSCASSTSEATKVVVDDFVFKVPYPPPPLKSGSKPKQSPNVVEPKQKPNGTEPKKKPKPSSGSRRRMKKGKAAATKEKEDRNKQRYVLSAMVWEDHEKPLYGCKLTPQNIEGEPLVLATCGGRRVTTYLCCDDGSLELLQCYEDPSIDECFYCCAWTDDRQGKPILAAAGAQGIIRIFSPSVGKCIKHFTGHGQSINDLVFHPKFKHILLSGSRDHAMRLWNIKTDVCVAIFGGVDGHIDEVLAVDINMTGTRIVSCGMDHNIKVWNLNTPRLEKLIKESNLYNPKNNRSGSFPTFKQQFADYSHRDVHKNYVDCAKWFGEFIISKSCEDTLVCWKGGTIDQEWDELDLETTDKTIIHTFDLEDCDIWFIRFSMDFFKTTLALGNKRGKTYVYDLSAENVLSIETHILSHPKCKSTIRQTALSRDGKVLICVCDDSSIWRWNINPDFKREGESETED